MGETKKQKKTSVNKESPDNQNGSRAHLWKKGQSGNPKGRPKGVTMKEYARKWLERMTEEERDAFMDGLPKEVIWKMAEGNPKQDTELSGNLTISEVLDQLENGPEIEGQDMAG